MGIRLYVLLFFGLGTLTAQGQSSVLAQGHWVRIGVTQMGIHRLDAAALVRAGFPATLDPRQLRLFGSGGGLLPQPNTAARPGALSENAIFIAGEADGRFDAPDYLLFYAQGPHRAGYDSVARAFRHQLHYAADTAYYFLTLGPAPGLRLSERPSVPASVVISTFDDYQFHEVEETNVLNSGRNWYGEYLGVTTEKTAEFRVPGLVADAPLRLTAAVMAAAPAETRFQFSLNGQVVGTLPVAPVRSERYDLKGIDSVRTFQTTLPTVSAEGRIRVAFRYDRVNQLSAQGYLNWLGLHSQRYLQVYDGQTAFRSLESRRYPAVIFQLREAPTALRVWDVRNPARPVQQQVVRSGAQAQFGVTTTGGLGEFIAFDASQALLRPISVQKIPNQELRGLAVPELLLVTAPVYLSAAQRLAEHRRRHDSLRVAVVTTDQVFNEFSSGQTDPTALRDFVRYLHRRAPGTLRYLLLLGDATYDFRNRRKGNEAAGYVPTYESRESLDPIYSYSSDDYFGFLEDHEGEWPETFSNDHTLDIGVGRLPVKTLAEAQGVVGKLIAYDSKAARGDWRTRLAFVGDDGDYNIHQQDADYLAQLVRRTQPGYRTDQILVDAFPQHNVPTGRQAPTVNEAINRAVREGVLVLNYTGHGGEAGWAQEQILTRSDVQGWRNFTRMPILMTATCEFGRYDNPSSVSGAELSVLNPRGGAIGLLTTARPAYASTNFLVNDAFYQTLFAALASGQRTRLGDVFRQTKNASLAGRINRNFSLLGDPSMRLPLPEVRLAVTRLNGQLPSPTDTLRARQTVSLEGHVRAVGDSGTLADFSGTALVTVYGPERKALTRGTESQAMSYQVQDDVWAQSRVTVQNGRFQTTFVVPARADSTPGTGLIRLYALRADSLREGIGSLAFSVKGRAVGTPVDTKSPVLQAWMNAETFRDGDEVPSSPTLLLRLTDERALDWGPGSVWGTLNDTLQLDLTPYLSPRLDDVRAATLRYRLASLPPGPHTLRLRARDADGNAAEVILQFFVGENTKVNRLNVVTAPNPFREKTQFRFEHDLVGEDATVDLEVYTMNGQLIQRISTIAYQMPSPFDEIFWEGTTLSKQALPRGFYFYRIFVRSLTANRQRSGSGKLFYAP